MAKNWIFLSSILLLSLSTMIVFANVRPSQSVRRPLSGVQTPFFQDNFSASSLDSSKWNASYATSGLRWCPSTIANHEDVSGNWTNVSTTGCMGQAENPPFGTLSVGGGSATFGSVAAQTFDYVWAGAPSKPSPFPPTGNFVLEVRMAYDTLTGSGDGFFVNRWNNTDPVGNNPPGGHPRVFMIWADSSGLVVQLLGNQSYYVSGEFGIHDYELQYLNGQYSVFVDGVSVIGPVASGVRPNAIWIGNPVFTWWSAPHYWSSFTLNEVQVTTPSMKISPSSGPVGTMVQVQGSDFASEAIEITFDDQFIGTKVVSNGTFTFTLNVPQAQPGSHEIKAVDAFGNQVATAEFDVTLASPSSLGVRLTVGTIYFPGDTVVATSLVTSNGIPLSSTSLQVHLNLTRPDGSNLSLNVTSIGSGLFRAQYSVLKTAQIGTYSIVATARSSQIAGSALATFEVKLPWLSSNASTAAVASIASVATIGVGLFSWKKGYFRRGAKDPF